MNYKYNPSLKNVKIESSDDAIKRGVAVQTTFFTDAELKKQKMVENETKLVSVKYDKQNDTHGAEHYAYLKSIGAK